MIIVMIYILSFLMVSSLSYMNFKEYNIRNQKPFNVLVAVILFFILIAYKPKVLLFLILLPYILSGPVINLYFFRKKRFANGNFSDIEEYSDIKGLDDQETAG